MPRICLVCDGEGWDEDGDVCIECNGLGEIDDDDDDDDDENDTGLVSFNDTMS